MEMEGTVVCNNQNILITWLVKRFNWMGCILAPPTHAYDWLVVFLTLTHLVCPSVHRTDPRCPLGK